MEMDSVKPTNVDYVIGNVCKQVYNIFPFVGIRYEEVWNRNVYDIRVRWYYKGIEFTFKYGINNDALDYVDDLDSVVNSIVLTICNRIMQRCNEGEQNLNYADMPTLQSAT